MKSTVLIAPLFVVLLNALMLPALYLYSNQPPVVVQPNPEGLGEAFYTPANVVASSGEASPIALTSAGPNGPYAKVVDIVMQSGPETDQAASVFSPSVVTLVLGVNNTATFVNQDVASVHTVASYEVPAGASAFSSGALKPGDSYTLTLNVRGAYYYGCTECPWMKGVIVVK